MSVVFQTNDPSAAQRTIQMVISKVKGGLRFEPATVVFNVARPNSISVIRLLLFADGLPDATVNRVTSSDPERFSATVGMLTPVELAYTRPGLPFAAIDVAANTASAGPLSGDVFVDIGGSRPHTASVKVSGYLESLVKIETQFVNLTNANSSTKIAIRSRNEENIKGTLLSYPSELSAGLMQISDSVVQLSMSFVPTSLPTIINKGQISIKITRGASDSELLRLPVYYPVAKP